MNEPANEPEEEKEEKTTDKQEYAKDNRINLKNVLLNREDSFLCL